MSDELSPLGREMVEGMDRYIAEEAARQKYPDRIWLVDVGRGWEYQADAPTFGDLHDRSKGAPWAAIAYVPEPVAQRKVVELECQVESLKQSLELQSEGIVRREKLDIETRRRVDALEAEIARLNRDLEDARGEIERLDRQRQESFEAYGKLKELGDILVRSLESLTFDVNFRTSCGWLDDQIDAWRKLVGEGEEDEE